MEKNTFNVREAAERIQEINGSLKEMAENLQKDEQREDYTAEEKAQKLALMKEREVLSMQVAAFNAPVVNREDAPKSAGEEFREAVSSIKKDHQSREIVLNNISGQTNDIKTSAAAIKLTVNDLLPRLEEGLIWGKVGMKVQTGVTGDIIWPYATDNVAFEEQGENVEFTDQKINFANIKAVPARSGATILVSNEAIDEATFDLLGFVQESFTLAEQNYLNWKTFSAGTGFTGIKGPWANNSASTFPTIGATYADILKAKAAIIAKGVDMNGFCYVIDAETEATLKATAKNGSNNGFIIENGLMAGDPYFVSHYLQTTTTAGTGTKGSAKDIKGADATDHFIGLGVWSNFAANQHGDVRLIIDPVTYAKSNQTAITLNTKWSLTTLRTEAFAIYKLA